MPESKSGALTSLAIPLHNLLSGAAFLSKGGAKRILELRLQQMRERMSLDRLGFPCLPLRRPVFAYFPQHFIRLLLIRKCTKNTGAGAGHPCFALPSEPVEGFGDLGKQRGCHDLQVVLSEAGCGLRR